MSVIVIPAHIHAVRVLNTRGVAFVTYSNEANAQFAKEAMAHQSLDHSEILNVRWATADPNPMAQAREARKIEEQAAEAVRRALPAEFVAEIEGRDPEARKRMKVENGFGLEGYEAPDDIYFARGVNAVNPLGRQGMEFDEQMLLIEGGEMKGDESGARAEVEGEAEAEQQSEGIFSNRTLAVLQSARRTYGPRAPETAPSGPLVAYDSDSE